MHAKIPIANTGKVQWIPPRNAKKLIITIIQNRPIKNDHILYTVVRL